MLVIHIFSSRSGAIRAQVQKRIQAWVVAVDSGFDVSQGCGFGLHTL